MMKRDKPRKHPITKNEDGTPKRRSFNVPAPEFHTNPEQSNSNVSNNSNDPSVACYNDVGRDAEVHRVAEIQVQKRQRRRLPNLRECPDCKVTREIYSRGRCRPCYALYHYRCQKADVSKHKKCHECKQVRIVNNDRLCEVCSKRIKRLRQGIDKRCANCNKICKKMVGNNCLNCHRMIAREAALIEGNYTNCRHCNKWASCPNNGICRTCSSNNLQPPIIQIDQSDNESNNSIEQLPEQPTLKYRHGIPLITSDEEECVELPTAQKTGKHIIKTIEQKKASSKSTKTATQHNHSKNSSRQKGIAQFLASTSSSLIEVQPGNRQTTSQLAARVNIEKNEPNQQQQFHQNTPQSLHDQLNRTPVEVCDIVLNPQDKNVTVRHTQRPKSKKRRQFTFDLTSTPANPTVPENDNNQEEINIDDQVISPILPQQEENEHQVQRKLSNQPTNDKNPRTPVNRDIAKLLRNWPNMFLMSSNMAINMSGPIKSPFATPRTVKSSTNMEATTNAKTPRSANRLNTLGTSNNRNASNNPPTNKENQQEAQPGRLKPELQPNTNYQNADNDIVALESQQVNNQTSIQRLTINNDHSSVEVGSEERSNNSVQIKIEPKDEYDYQNATDEVIAMESQENFIEKQLPIIFVQKTNQCLKKKANHSIVEISSDDEKNC